MDRASKTPKMKRSLLILMVVMFATACYYRSEEELYPDNQVICDTTGVTYSKTVLPILQNNCYECHSASNNAESGGSLNLEDFSLLQALARGGNVYGAITHDPLYIPMPKGRAQLDSCSIAKIKVWIDSGSSDNLP